MLRSLCLALVALAAGGMSSASAQTVDVTFRFLPDLTPPGPNPVRAFLPGSFNDWGPNSSGQIAVGAPSQMTEAGDEYRYTIPLAVGGGPVSGGGYAYKVHYHENASGSQYVWLTDPLGTETTGPNSDSVVRVADPMAFQLAREQNTAGEIVAVSAGLFGTAAFTDVTFTVNTATYTLADLTDTGDGIYRLALPAPVPVGSFFGVEATDAQSRTAEASVGTVPPDVEDAAVPAGLVDGINYDPADPTKATVVLRAPGKSYVYVRGAFNGWQTLPSGLMKRDAAAQGGTRWWAEITGLTPGETVPFQYLVDGTIEVADPYTPLVIYPGEPSFPAGQTSFAVGVLQPGAAPFPWTDAGYVRPAQEDLVVYELLVRDFVADHSFTALTDTLDYLQRLGVNAVELMPVAEFDGDRSWGYNPAFHLALDKYYGSPDELKAFVDAAHARGIAVILDVVYNHATGQSPLIRLYNSGGFSGPTPGSPYANVSATHPFNVFNDLNHESELTQIWLDRANDYWVEEYHIDGFRFDLTGGFMQTGDFFGYNPSRIDLLKRMMDAHWDEHPQTYMILEHLINSDQEWRELGRHRTEEGLPGAILWNNQHFAYKDAALGQTAANLSATYPTNWVSGLPVGNAMTYMESHDEQWMMYENLNFGVQDGAYDIRDFPTAIQRQKLAGTFFLTVPGPRMIWQFGELGYGGGPGECLFGESCPPGTPGRTDAKPIRWDYHTEGVAPVRGDYSGGALTPASDTERSLRNRLYGTWAALLGLRADHEVFRSPDTEFRSKLVGADRWIKLKLPSAGSGEVRDVVIVGNFGTQPADVAPTWPRTGAWYNFFEDGQTEITDQGQALTLAPGAFRVYTDVDVPSPDPFLISTPSDAGPETAALAVGVAPNPVRSRATVRWSLDAPGDASLALYDMLGRRVALLAEGAQPAGAQTISLDASALPSGVYVLRLTAGDRAETARVTVVR